MWPELPVILSHKVLIYFSTQLIKSKPKQQKINQPTKQKREKKPHKQPKKHTEIKKQVEQLFCTVRNYSLFLRAFFKNFKPKQNIYSSVQIYFI